MIRPASLVLAMIAVCCTAMPLSAAESSVDFDATYARAQAAVGHAGELKNQWTTTLAALAAAKKAADAGDLATAIRLAQQAEDLANASIAQAEREKDLWKESEIR